MMFLFLFRDISIVLLMLTFGTAGLTFPTSRASTNNLAYGVPAFQLIEWQNIIKTFKVNYNLIIHILANV